MLNEATVSVVVPVYNQQAYLDQSIPSILSQTYQSLEIILVDDGSVDKSAIILKKYADMDKRIKIVSKENGGLVSASIAGVRNSSGDYICFLDPDDYYGPSYIENFMCEMAPDIDIIAAGFYRNNNGYLDPVYLEKDIIYDVERDKLRETFLIKKGKQGVSDQIFISRWNKCYKASLVHLLINSFEEYTDISLGEDSIFTYLVLRYAKKIKTLSYPNEYYYNIGNQSSMMNNGQISTHIRKSISAYEAMQNLLKQDNLPQNSALALYYFLMDALLNRIVSNDLNGYKKLSHFLRKDRLYHESIKIVYDVFSSQKSKILLKVKGSAFPELYFGIYTLTKQMKPIVRWWINEPRIYLNDVINKGGGRANSLALFRKNRNNAFEDLNKYLPILEKRIYPFLKDHLDEKTELDSCPIAKNIFVFWWDGFAKAPEIVKACLESVKTMHPGYTIYEVTKDNYYELTDINDKIIKAFNMGKISIQTFSDILRFNLLKNNGGVWIDATIYFAAEYDLSSNLYNKSFESVVFSSSESFLNYENLKCSWSGYYIASRKNGVLVSVMDSIFEQYYLRYGTYSIYFFIDAALMICKKYKIDDVVLDKVHCNNNSMFLLSKVLNAKYNVKLLRQVQRIPQKLSWFGISENKTGDSMYNVLFAEKK